MITKPSIIIIIDDKDLTRIYGIIYWMRRSLYLGLSVRHTNYLKTFQGLYVNLQDLYIKKKGWGLIETIFKTSKDYVSDSKQISKASSSMGRGSVEFCMRAAPINTYQAYQALHQ